MCYDVHTLEPLLCSAPLIYGSRATGTTTTCFNRVFRAAHRVCWVRGFSFDVAWCSFVCRSRLPRGGVKEGGKWIAGV